MALQFHYIVMYDESTNEWTIEDETRYLDGNIYDTDKAERDGYGWFWADDDTDTAADDMRHHGELFDALQTIKEA